MLLKTSSFFVMLNFIFSSFTESVSPEMSNFINPFRLHNRSLDYDGLDGEGDTKWRRREDLQFKIE